MSRATHESIDGNLFDSLNDRNTVISCCNVISGEHDIIGVAYVNAICVGAIGRCRYLDSSYSDVYTVCDEDMKAFGVQ